MDGPPVIKLGHRPTPLESLEAEIRSEIASTLGRVGHLLEQRLDEMDRLRAQAADLQGAERAVHVARFNELRQQAREYIWYLMVQREAIGLRNHKGLEERYPIPPALRV